MTGRRRRRRPGDARAQSGAVLLSAESRPCDGACARWYGWPWKKSPSTPSPRTAGSWPTPRPVGWPNCSRSTPARRRGLCESCANTAWWSWNREKGPAGRFGLSVYVLGKIAGLTVLGPGAVEPHSALPSVDEADRDKPHTAAAGVEKPCADGAYGVAPGTALAHLATEPVSHVRGSALVQATTPLPADGPSAAARLSVPAMQIPGQGTLDLDGGIA